jgi:hypothetical protein
MLTSRILGYILASTLLGFIALRLAAFLPIWEVTFRDRTEIVSTPSFNVFVIFFPNRNLIIAIAMFCGGCLLGAGIYATAASFRSFRSTH